jgi:hypothetical protein
MGRYEFMVSGPEADQSIDNNEAERSVKQISASIDGLWKDHTPWSLSKAQLRWKL